MRATVLALLALAFTVGAAQAQYTTGGGGSGSAFNPASPGAIGGTTPAAGTFTNLSATANGALSAPVVSANGTWVSGGSATTTKPAILIEPSTATSTGWSTSGTGLGVNAASGFSGRIIDAQSNGTSILFVSASTLQMQASQVITWNGRGNLSSPASGTVQLGVADAAAPVAQVLSAQSVVTGTSNTAGTNLTLKGSAGTGTGAGGSVIVQVAPAGSTGSTPNTKVDALTIDSTKLAVFTGAVRTLSTTVALLPSAATSGAGARAFVTDGSTTVILGLGLTVVGGGANKVPVYSDGTNWIVG